ncbi:hypothetical protein GCM10009662_04000 [Catellatospora coxensis]|uniref:Uncharacterized protein n=1 Tax=Catellatospora coxensis TaxID=310354 RepID=A0A8J3KLG6_9ACTN|nr:hypothetical protein Cco03nite_14630 [Catellatospora coxensis]
MPYPQPRAGDRARGDRGDGLTAVERPIGPSEGVGFESHRLQPELLLQRCAGVDRRGGPAEDDDCSELLGVDVGGGHGLDGRGNQLPTHLGGRLIQVGAREHVLDQGHLRAGGGGVADQDTSAVRNRGDGVGVSSRCHRRGDDHRDR